MILSPNRCIILCTLAQVTQTLPSMTSSRLSALASKYRQIEVVVDAKMGNTQGTGEFCGYLETLRQREGCGVRVVFGRDLERWIGFLALNREIDGEDFSRLLQVEETAVIAPISFPIALQSDY